MDNRIVNILLIENQETQFRKFYNIFKKDDLSRVYKIYPNESEYIKFIDIVRVWVNENYGSYDKNNLNNTINNLTYRELAMNIIIQTIIDSNIDVLLMDYKLGAGYLSKTGIDLATEINMIQELKGHSTLPTIFISKDQKNIEIEEKLKEYKWEKSWIYKGFFGDEILQPKYIKEYVINGAEGIVTLLSKRKDLSKRDQPNRKSTD